MCLYYYISSLDTIEIWNFSLSSVFTLIWALYKEMQQGRWRYAYCCDAKTCIPPPDPKSPFQRVRKSQKLFFIFHNFQLFSVRSFIPPQPSASGLYSNGGKCEEEDMMKQQPCRGREQRVLHKQTLAGCIFAFFVFNKASTVVVVSVSYTHLTLPTTPYV